MEPHHAGHSSISGHHGSHVTQASHAGHVDHAVSLHHEGQKHEQVHHKEKHSQPDNSTYYAQQNLFVFDELTFDSRFECGNLMQVDQSATGHYTLWIAPDNYKTEYQSNHKVWYYFKVSNADLSGHHSRTFTFKVANMSKHEANNFKNGMVPVCKGPSTHDKWQYIPTPLKSFQAHKDGLEIEFEYEITEQDSRHGIYFAFTFPYTYTDCNNLVNTIEQAMTNDPNVFFHRQVLTHSLEGRRIEVLTITGNDHQAKSHEASIPNLFPEGGNRPPQFKNKKYILISCRIHPCEAPASFMLQGFLLSLTNKSDPVTQALLQDFVFVVIPMLNPDGVIRGHYRTDSKGRDLNRVYHKAIAEPSEYPAPYAVMKLGESLADGRLVMYLDLHAHSNKDSGFVFGTFTPEVEARAEIRLFARMFDIYSKNFDYTSCGFGQPMDPEHPDPSKTGIGKTEVGKLCNIFHNYTLECGYTRRSKDPERYTNNPEKDVKKKVYARIDFTDFFEIGENVRHALLETLASHPCSIVPHTWYKSSKSTRKRIVEQLLKEPPPEPKKVTHSKNEDDDECDNN